MICGLLVPTAGRVTVHDVDVERQPEEAQRHLGYLADFFSVYDDLTVWEYVDYFAHAYKMALSTIPARVDEVIGWVGLEGKRDSVIAGLSRGMKQRLGNARANLHGPPVHVHDEPTSGLDPKARHELKQLFVELNRSGATLFITTHILSDVEEMCTSVAILEKGRLLRCGPLAAVMQESRGARRAPHPRPAGRSRLCAGGMAGRTARRERRETRRRRRWRGIHARGGRCRHRGARQPAGGRRRARMRRPGIRRKPRATLRAPLQRRDDVIPLFSNPEFIRNCRAQLRPRRMLLVGSVIAALSLAIGYSMYQWDSGSPAWGNTLLTLALSAQMLVLIMGGGIACGLSISREKEQNTFDFQRVTQLTSLELALGKLFGAPVLSYFIAICLLPAALVGALAGGVPLSHLAGAYLLMFTSSVAFNAFALLFSMSTTRAGVGIAGLALVFVFLLSNPYDWLAERMVFDLGSISPSAAVDFALYGTWQVQAMTPAHSGSSISQSRWTDVLFGWPVHHLPVLLVLYLSFAAWCLVPLARNLKKDPAIVELYSPAQAVSLLCYVNFIMVGFYLVWRPYSRLVGLAEKTLSGTFQFFLIVNLALLSMLGIALLRNREQARRRAHQRASSGFDWMEAGWPTVCILAGAAAVALTVLVRFALVGEMKNDLNVPFAAFQTALLLAALLRDLCFLQWMNLRRTRRPLLVAVVLLGVFYICGGILLSVARFSELVSTVFTAVFLPWPVIGLEPAQWAVNPGPWLIGLAVQIALVVLFAALHYRVLEDLRPAAVAPSRLPAES